MSVRGACLTALALLGAIATCNGLVVPLSPSNPATSLSGITLPRADGVGEASTVDLGQAVASTSGKTLVVLGTHAADFNSVEYIQRVKAYWPRLEAKGVNRCLVVINGESDQCEKLAELLDVPKSIEILADPTGEAGRRFGVSRGFRPDDAGLRCGGGGGSPLSPPNNYNNYYYHYYYHYYHYYHYYYTHIPCTHIHTYAYAHTHAVRS